MADCESAVVVNVSVVVPAYNCASTIGSCIESLLAQHYSAGCYEIIVVDNNSSDGTASIASNYPVRLTFERDRQCPAAARNKGIALAQHDIIAFVDADCLAEPGWLSNLVGPFSEPDVGLVGGRIESQVPDSGLIEEFFATIGNTSSRLYETREPKGLPTGNIAYRRAALERVGVFDAAMPLGVEDVDLAWRVQVYGRYRAAFVEEAVVYHKHRSSLASLFNQRRKYGIAEIILSTLYYGQSFHMRTVGYQLRGMLRQLRALLIYPFSFLVRLIRWRRWQTDRMYLAWPLLWVVLDCGYLLGKLEGLVKTRFFRRNPYPTNPQEVRRHPVDATSCSG